VIFADHDELQPGKRIGEPAQRIEESREHLGPVVSRHDDADWGGEPSGAKSEPEPWDGYDARLRATTS
jgi:hypothetical protein